MRSHSTNVNLDRAQSLCVTFVFWRQPLTFASPKSTILSRALAAFPSLPIVPNKTIGGTRLLISASFQKIDLTPFRTLFFLENLWGTMHLGSNLNRKKC